MINNEGTGGKMKKYVIVLMMTITAIAAVLVMQARSPQKIQPVPEIRTGKDTSRLPAEHLRSGSPAADAGDMDLSGIEVPADGKSIAALHGEKQSLVGKEVIVRGKVVKFTANVMQKNWVHLRDGTGTGETADVTLTTSAVVALGDIVVAKGRLVIDQDFGSGYRYAILIENAGVTVESTASMR